MIDTIKPDVKVAVIKFKCFKLIKFNNFFGINQAGVNVFLSNGSPYAQGIRS